MPLLIDPNVEELVFAESSSRAICKVKVKTPAPMGGVLVYTPKTCADYIDEGLSMHRFGARFTTKQRTVGAVYGFVFRLQRGGDQPSREMFYSWCDSHSVTSAEIGRWILDAGVFEKVFAQGDTVVLDEFEFARSVPVSAQVKALRAVVATLAVQPALKRLRQAFVIVDGFHCPPGTLKHRKAFKAAFAIARAAKLGEKLRAAAPQEDVLLNRGREMNPAEELAELVKRSGPGEIDSRSAPNPDNYPRWNPNL
jgi:hypothetical protein